MITALVREMVLEVSRKASRPVEKANSNSENDEQAFSLDQSYRNPGLLMTRRRLVDAPCCWLVDRSECTVRNCWEQWTRGSYPRAENRVWSDQEDHEERGSKDRVASTCGPHSDSFSDTSRRRRSNCSTNNFQTPCRSKSLIQAPFPCTPFNTGTLGTASTVVQARSMWNVTEWQRLCLVMNPRLFWGRMKIVYRCGGALVRDSSMAGPLPLPDLSPVEQEWDPLKRPMPSCHSVHDLELAVQDLWAHLPQDNIRCLINSMPDHVAASIAAGGGPTRY
ncbi:uncharacterized protein TNCV_377181 [Trichonephila clavipes]|nr:uncharacterized protein TNCV_377181 [Trichonephila clavipes]